MISNITGNITSNITTKHTVIINLLPYYGQILPRMRVNVYTGNSKHVHAHARIYPP
jgi:hypothetical protein